MQTITGRAFRKISLFNSQNMESKRQERVARQIQKDISEIFMKNPSLVNNAFVTVTVVRVTKDLSIAKIYLSMLAVKDREDLLADIDERKNEIRGELGKRIRHQFRKVPELIFHIDDTQDEVQRIEELFEETDIPPTDEEEGNGSD